jgi:hypothetical protein
VNEQRILRIARLGGLGLGSLCLLWAMLVVPEEPGSRDLAWSVGVAALVLALVANWLLRRAEDREKGP